MYFLIVALVVVGEISALVGLRLLAPGVPVLAFSPVVPVTLVVAFLARGLFGGASRASRGTLGARALRRLSPEAVAGYGGLAEPAEKGPEEISRSIVERAEEIKRALAESPTDEVRVEMCALGYRACVNDMITLTHRANEDLRNANPLKRLRVRRARRRATDALAGAREALPPGALRTSRQEQQ